MAKKSEKTNVMRILDSHGIKYTFHDYSTSGTVAANEVADALGQDPARMFKTLVTVSTSGEHYVFMVPADKELNLKLAASAVHEKKLEMIKQKELLPLTGYIHGGCSPIGMKKQFRTIADESALGFDTIMFSGGRIGAQVEMSPADLKEIIPVEFATITG